MNAPEPSITLDPEAAEEHQPQTNTLPEFAGPSLQCTCGATMYAASAIELPRMWRTHLLLALGLMGLP